jgi:sugar phosphate isomerase/epimerase
VFVAATTQCYPHLPLDEAVEKLADLEFSHIEISVSENGNHLKPSFIRDHFSEAYDIIHSTRRLGYGSRVRAKSILTASRNAASWRKHQRSSP